MATMTLAGIYAAQGYYNKALKIYHEILDAKPDDKEALEMVEKIKDMIDSSNREVEETFDEEVMSISIDDISDDMVENTAGLGIGSPGEEDEVEEVEEEEEKVSGGSVLGDEDELEAVARELEDADRRDVPEEEDPEGASHKGAAREGMDNFRQWLEGMKDAPEDDKQ